MEMQAPDFHLPDYLNASSPPERRGIRRDHVRLMVLDSATPELRHDSFYQLDRYLQPGDLLVLNNSRTVPAVMKAIKQQEGNIDGEYEFRLASRIGEDTWEVLSKSENVLAGDEFLFGNCLHGIILSKEIESPIVRMKFSESGAALSDCIYRIGEPIRYEYIGESWKLDYYQTVYAAEPGSVEMPSAGRAFSWELLFKLHRKGVRIAFIQLHTGLSYLLDDKWDHSPEKNYENYTVPAETMQMVRTAKSADKRIIAVGTTVVRALETAALTGRYTGRTNLYIREDSQLQVCDGIITGFHEPKASHLEMLAAFIDKEELLEAYQKAISAEYLWHEFGDMNLIINGGMKEVSHEASPLCD